jgi:hypothetical protein
LIKKGRKKMAAAAIVPLTVTPRDMDMNIHGHIINPSYSHDDCEIGIDLNEGPNAPRSLLFRRENTGEAGTYKHALLDNLGWQKLQVKSSPKETTVPKPVQKTESAPSQLTTDLVERSDVKLPPVKKPHKFYETDNPKRSNWKRKMTTNRRRKERDAKNAFALNVLDGEEDENVPASKYEYDSLDDSSDDSSDDYYWDDWYYSRARVYDSDDYYLYDTYDSDDDYSEDYYYKKNDGQISLNVFD